MTSAFNIIRIFFVVNIALIVGAIYTFVYRFRNTQRAKLEGKVRYLTAQAIEHLNCGLSSNIITLPTTGINLHVVEGGNDKGDLIILLHGFPDCWYAWKSVIPHLVEAGYFVVTPDLRGYNLSDKPKGIWEYELRDVAEDVEGLLEHYKRDKAIIVGHDWGGAVGWYLATKKPEIVSKLIILNSPHPAALRRDLAKNPLDLITFWYFLYFSLPILPVSLLTYHPNLFVRRYFHKLSQLDEDIQASAWVQHGAMESMLNYYKSLLRTIISNFGHNELTKVKKLRTKDSASNGTVVEQKPIVKAETLIIWGEKDLSLPKESSECSEWVPNLTVRYILEATHYVLQDSPKTVTNYILEFLGKVTPSH